MKKPLSIPVGPKKAAPQKTKSPRGERDGTLRNSAATVIELGDNCEKCKFYLPSTLQTEGACRRYPPTPVATMQGITNVFPGMQSVGWCGEFKDKIAN